jgi:hypothetical protein
VGTLPKRSRTVALNENVVLGAEEKCVTTIPGLPYYFCTDIYFTPTTI